jgi:LmbE family N-acetylglucosaminyl deacetylase
MDDETLGCGGTMALHEDKQQVHCVFCTDGAESPAPLLPWQGRVDPGLPERRRKEAVAALGVLGVPPENLHFLDLPDGRLTACRRALRARLAALINRLRPDYVFAPFRYDVHADHVALNRAARAALLEVPEPPALLEYFVYNRLRFVPGGDVRQALDRDRLVEVDTTPVAKLKRAALDCYVTQTRVDYPWQERPILTEESMVLRCAEPEHFLCSDAAGPLDEGVIDHAWRINLGTFAMRHGKRPKDRAVAFLRWATRR